MSDLLVKLYEFPQIAPVLERLQTDDILIRRAMAVEKSAVTDWVREHFSNGVSCECEVAFSRQPVACFIATRNGAACGFCCYGVVCPDFLGPLGVGPKWQKREIGTGLLLAGLEALRAQGYAYAIIGWAGPVGFFQKTVGAKIIENSEPGIYRGLLKSKSKL